jgi:hypothetical protein
MFQELYQTVLAWRKALHGETQFIIPAVPANTRFDFTISPPEGYYAMIIWLFSYGDILSNVFRFYAGVQSERGGGMTYHTGLLDPWTIARGIPTWLYICQDDRPLMFSLENTDSVPHFFQSWIWQLNVPARDNLLEIERRIENMGMLPEMMADLISKELQIKRAPESRFYASHDNPLEEVQVDYSP